MVMSLTEVEFKCMADMQGIHLPYCSFDSYPLGTGTLSWLYGASDYRTRIIQIFVPVFSHWPTSWLCSAHTIHTSIYIHLMCIYVMPSMMMSPIVIIGFTPNSLLNM